MPLPHGFASTLALFMAVCLAPCGAQTAGDCDASGTLDVLDGLRAARLSVGTALVAGAPVDACDVDRDRNVSVLDAFKILCLAAGFDVGAPVIRFADSTAASGIDFVHHDGGAIPPLYDDYHTRFGCGGAVGDYDHDGDMDIYACDSLGFANKLYANDGQGHFTEVGVAAGVAEHSYSHMALFVDLDDDGWDDLVVLNDSDGVYPGSTLYRNRGDGSFEDVTAGSGFAPNELIIGGATAGDYDRDGDLDLVVVGWEQRLLVLYRNEGAFRFTDVTAAAGLRSAWTDVTQWTPVLADFDRDGWPDLFAAVDFTEDYLFLNQHDGTFAFVADTANCQHLGNDMGVAVGDLDGDLDLDIFCTNVTDEVWSAPGCCNVLYVNDGNAHFSWEHAERGVAQSWWGWGTWFADLDLDADLDLVAVDGWNRGWYTQQPARFFRNDGMGYFEEDSAHAGLAHVGDSHGLVPLDLEGDGDIDFLVFDELAPATVLENQTQLASHHWLAVEARGTLSPASGVGCQVTITAGGRQQYREIFVGGSFYACPPREAHFGLGRADIVDQLRVWFPSGREVVLTAVPVDQRIVVTEP